MTMENEMNKQYKMNKLYKPRVTKERREGFHMMRKMR
jgi:hypothetical protein